MKVWFLSTLVTISLLCIACTSAEQAANKPSTGLELVIKIDESQLASEKIVLVSTLHNASPNVVSFLTWNTPFDIAISGAFLSIQSLTSNKELPYLGIKLKRLAPSQDDYLSILPGQTVSHSLDISKSYQFCSSSVYNISFPGPVYDAEWKEILIHFEGDQIKLGSGFAEC